jgi:type IV secretion system protein VirB3
MAALLCHSLQPLVLVPILLVASYLVCLKDVFLFDIAGAALRLKVCRNKRLWGCRRYAPR